MNLVDAVEQLDKRANYIGLRHDPASITPAQGPVYAVPGDWVVPGVGRVGDDIAWLLYCGLALNAGLTIRHEGTATEGHDEEEAHEA